jgi:ABC-type multidrug transport system fused ATPase/permease subunit
MVIFFRNSIDPKLLAFSLQNLSDSVVFFAITVRMSADFQTFMTSAQAMVQYTKLESEDALIKEYDAIVDKDCESKSSGEDKVWPHSGAIEFKNVSMRYRPTLEPSVKNLNCLVQPGMKVGIVGRTGAGKSSILQILFRLSEIEPEGSVLIDGTDIRKIGLHKLRKNVGYIPQSPFLISGTIRENLDPF